MIKSRLSIFLITVFALGAIQSFAFDSTYIPPANIMVNFDNLTNLEEIKEIRKKNRALAAEGKSVNVTVIGAGPGGLVAALEAYMNGAKVVLVERRVQYTRQQVLQIETEDLNKYSKAFEGKFTDKIELSRLEEILYSVVKVLAENDPKNLTVLYGYYLPNIESKPIEIGPHDQTTVTVLPSVLVEGMAPIKIPTQFLIGADSLHSNVRKLAGIPAHKLTKHVPVMIALFTNDKKDMDELDDLRWERREKLRQANYHLETIQKELEQKKDAELLYWNERLVYLGLQLTEEQYKKLQEAKDLPIVAREIIAKTVFEPEFFSDFKFAPLLKNAANPSFFTVDLQKAKEVAVVKDNILIMLLGDAAATTHFFSGTGANRAMTDAINIGSIVKLHLTTTSSLKDLAKTYQKITKNSICKMHEIVIAQKLGIQGELEMVKNPPLTASSLPALMSSLKKRGIRVPAEKMEQKEALENSLKKELRRINKLSESLSKEKFLFQKGACEIESVRD